MANANASRPGNPLDRATSGMEIAIPKDVTIGINKDRDVVRRTTMSNGNVIETQVFPGEYPDAETFKTPEQIESAAKKAADVLAAAEKKAAEIVAAAEKKAAAAVPKGKGKGA